MNLKFECLQEILCDGFIFFISSLDLFGKISPSCLLLVGNGRLNDRPLDFDPRDSLDGISFKNGGICPRYSILMIHTLVSTPKQLMFMDVPCPIFIVFLHLPRSRGSYKVISNHPGRIWERTFWFVKNKQVNHHLFPMNAGHKTELPSPFQTCSWPQTNPRWIVWDQKTSPQSATKSVLCSFFQSCPTIWVI